MESQGNVSLWLRWVGANSLAELLGLGATLAIDFLVVSRVAAVQTVAALLAAIGMPLIFAAIDLAQRYQSLAAALATTAAGLLMTGALVGAVHGLALVWLASPAAAVPGAAH